MGNAAATLGIRLGYDDEPYSPFDGGSPPAAMAGTTVTGLVFAEVTKRIKGRNLVVHVVGKEKSFVKNAKSSRRAERLILQIDIPLKEFHEEQILPGRYEFPFIFDLPLALPSSMKAVDGGSWSFIKYKVKARLTVSGSFSRGNEVERPLNVASAPIPPDPVPFIVAPVAVQVHAFHCLKRGSITFGVNVEDTRVGRGQEIEVNLACRNDTIVDIKRLEVKITEVVTWKADGRSHSSETALAFEPDIGVPEGLEKKTKKELRSSIREGVDPLQQHYQHIYEEITSRTNVIKLKIPESARDTYSGQIVACKHNLIVTIKTQRAVDDPTVAIPLHIGSPPMETLTHQSAPPLPQEDIPIATVVPVDWSNVPVLSSPMVIAQADSVRLGGSTLHLGSDDQDEVDWTPISPPSSPTLAHLLEEMLMSVNDYEMIATKIADPDWRTVFVCLNPSEYGNVISHVNVDFDQPKVAAMIAPVINNGNFTCVYCVAAIRNTATWNRIVMVQRLIPFCVDIGTGQDLIKAELSSWELTVTALDFSAALSRQH